MPYSPEQRARVNMMLAGERPPALTDALGAPSQAGGGIFGWWPEVRQNIYDADAWAMDQIGKYGGPHLEAGIRNLADLATVTSMGADVQGMTEGSARAAEGAQAGDLSEAFFGGTDMTANLASLLIPGSAAGMKRMMSPADARRAPTPTAFRADAPTGAKPGTPAERVLEAARDRPSFTDWRRANETPPSLFEQGLQPDVPQSALTRYKPRKVSRRMIDALSSRRVRNKIKAAVERGAKAGGGEWYNTEALRRVFVDELGEKAGNAEYRVFMQEIAATSPRNPIPQNIAAASYYHWLNKNLEELGELPPLPAAGYGNLSQKLHRQNIKDFQAGYDIIKNPKPASFAENLAGNWRPATIDTHNMRVPAMASNDPEFLMSSVPGNKLPDGSYETLRPRDMFERGDLSLAEARRRPGFWESKPRANEYDFYENFQTEQARRMGMSPAQYQANMWVGAGEQTGLSSPPETFMTTFEARVKFTADQLDMSPTDVLRKFVRGEMPLLSAAGALSAGGAAGAMYAGEGNGQAPPPGL